MSNKFGGSDASSYASLHGRITLVGIGSSPWAHSHVSRIFLQAKGYTNCTYAAQPAPFLYICTFQCLDPLFSPDTPLPICRQRVCSRTAGSIPRSLHFSICFANLSSTASEPIEVGVSATSSASLPFNLILRAFTLTLQTRIHKDRISNYPIRLPGISAMQMPALPSMSIMGLGSSTPKPEVEAKRERDREAEGTGEEQWTRACRAVLTVLKRVLVVESEAERAIVGSAAPA